MKYSQDQMRALHEARDPSANGHFLAGVMTTKIYCLPSCPARMPRAENVVYLATEADALAAGLRACRRCRPDHFYRRYDPDLERLTALAEQIRRDPAAFPDSADWMAAAQMGTTKFHALLRRHYQVTPAAFLNRARIAAACRLLETAGKSAGEVGFAVGYDSLSAFHENFRRATGLTPGEYARLGAEPQFTLTLPADFYPPAPLHAWGRDTESNSERVNENQILKSVWTGQQAGLLSLELRPGLACVRIEAAKTLAPQEIRAAHAVALRLLGLAADPAPFERRADSDPAIRRLLGNRRGLRLPLTADFWEGAVWAILGQQISLPFAYALRRRLLALCGVPVGNGFFAHPSPEAVAALGVDDLLPWQFSRRKAEYLIGLAQSLVSGELPGNDLAEMPFGVAEAKLLAMRGLGPWSAHYILMRACGFADCVPVGDTGLTAALKRLHALDVAPDAAQTLALMEPFAPYRSLATYHLWQFLKGEN